MFGKLGVICGQSGCGDRGFSNFRSAIPESALQLGQSG